jgi:hypothetical protein
MAIVHAGFREYDQALHWLERCCDEHDVHVVFLTIDPKWDPVRGDVRFLNVLQRCGLSYGIESPSLVSASDSTI